MTCQSCDGTGAITRRVHIRRACVTCAGDGTIGGRTCPECRGLGNVVAAEHAPDACPECAVAAETEWRLARGEGGT